MKYNVGDTVFNDWQICEEIGEGSYGKVYKITKSSFGVESYSALKVISIPRSVQEIKDIMSEGMDDKSVTSHFEDIVEQFVREIAIMSDLKVNPNIVSVEDYVIVPHKESIGWDILIRMELLTPLQDYQLANQFDEKTVIKLAKDISGALNFCQKKGLIHRDVKPGNIFVDSEGVFKLGDFGVARVADKTSGGYSKQGTENYMAPEVYLARPYNANVDIYSLGLMLYRLVNNNRLPFYPQPPEPIRFADRETALKKRMDGTPLPWPANASEEFAGIIMKACAYDPKDRYVTAGEMLSDLKELSSEEAQSFATDEGAFGKEKSFTSFSGGEDNDRTYSPFASNVTAEQACSPTQNEELGDRTVSPFGTYKDDEDDGDKTVSPFGNSNSKAEVPPRIETKDLDVYHKMAFDKETCPYGKKIRIKVQGRAVEILIPESIKDGQTIEAPFMGKSDAYGNSGTLFVNVRILDKKKEVSVTEEFWKKHLGEVLKEKKGSWGAYFGGDITLQMYANAIHNITGGKANKSEIIGILDYTSDFKIPCGAGIVVTKEKMYLQLGAEDWGNGGFLIGGIPVKEITFANLKTINYQPKTFFVHHKILWQNKDGSSHEYKNIRQGKAFDNQVLVNIIKKYIELIKGE